MTTQPTEDLTERVARAMFIADDWQVEFEAVAPSTQEEFRTMARAAIAALAPELNRADLTIAAVVKWAQAARRAGRKIDPDEVIEQVNEAYRVVMK